MLTIKAGCHGVDSSPMSPDALQDFKAAMRAVMSAPDMVIWVRRPNDTLDDETPLAVFFRDGLDAVLPALRQEQRAKQ